MMLNSFKLNNYLSKQYIIKNLPKVPVNDLPEIDDILLRIKNFLEENECSNWISGHGQLYTYTHNFSNGDYFNITWDIDKIKSIVEYLKLPIEKLNVTRLYNAI